MSEDVLKKLAEWFEFHGKNAYGSSDPRNNSPLYRELALRVAKDADILKLVTEADRATQVSNLLFGAVHYLLLMRDDDHPLMSYYASLVDQPLIPEGAYPHFREFCLTHADEIRRLVTTRRVQTNEVGRCTALVPTFERVSQRVGRVPLALIEIGTSAGLHLIWEQYQYEYHPGGILGRKDSVIRLPCEVRKGQPPLPVEMPKIVWRVGIDLNPLDVSNPDAMLWLRSLIWPEQGDRAMQLQMAIETAQQNPPRLVAANASNGISELLAQAPQDAYPVILHSYTFNQMPPDIFEQANESIRALSVERELSRIALEWWGGEATPTLDVYEYRGGEYKRTRLAICESHGRWLEWQAG